MCSVLRLAEQAAAETDGRPYALEGVGVQLLRHQADQRARLAIGGLDVLAADQDAALARIGNAADDRDQRGLAGAVGAEQRKDLDELDVEIDVLERLEAEPVDLRQID